MDKIKALGMSIVEIIIFVGVLGMCYVFVGACMVFLGVAEVQEFDQQVVDDPYNMLMLIYLPIFIGSIIGVLIVHQVIFKRPFSFSGLTTQNVTNQFFKGVMWSALVLTLGFGILYVLGWMKVDTIEMNAYLFFGFMILSLIHI